MQSGDWGPIAMNYACSIDWVEVLCGGFFLGGGGVWRGLSYRGFVRKVFVRIALILPTQVFILTQFYVELETTTK